MVIFDCPSKVQAHIAYAKASSVALSFAAWLLSVVLLTIFMQLDPTMFPFQHAQELKDELTRSDTEVLFAVVVAFLSFSMLANLYVVVPHARVAYEDSAAVVA